MLLAFLPQGSGDPCEYIFYANNDTFPFGSIETFTVPLYCDEIRLGFTPLPLARSRLHVQVDDVSIAVQLLGFPGSVAQYEWSLDTRVLQLPSSRVSQRRGSRVQLESH